MAAKAAIGVLVAGALLGAGATAASAQFAPVVVSDFQTNRYVAPVVDSFGGITVFSETDQTKRQYHLTVLVAGQRLRLPVAPRSVPFDIDLGPDDDGRIVAAYSRCRIEPTSSRAALWAKPYPAWTTGRGCDIYRYDFTSGQERKISGASTNEASEVLPSIWKGDVAFTRVYERRSGRRGDYPYLYIRELSRNASSDRQPGGSRGELGVPGPTRLDLYGRRLAFVWNHATQLPGGDRRGAGVSELRLDTRGGGHRVLSSAEWRNPARDFAAFAGPTGADGRITYGFGRLALGALDGDRSQTSLLLRYRLSNGDRSRAEAPDLTVDAAIDGPAVVAGTGLDFFDTSGPGSVLRNATVDWQE